MTSPWRWTTAANPGAPLSLQATAGPIPAVRAISGAQWPQASKPSPGCSASSLDKNRSAKTDGTNLREHDTNRLGRVKRHVRLSTEPSHRALSEGGAERRYGAPLCGAPREGEAIQWTGRSGDS